MPESNGADVVLLVNGSAVGSQRNVTFSEALAMIDISSKESRASKFLGGRYSATVSLDALWVDDDTALAALRTAVRGNGAVTIRRRFEGADVEEASAIITSLSEAAPDQDAATVSVELQITGSWSAV